MRGFHRTIVSLVAAFLVAAAFAAPIRVTTWNLEWFPNGSPKDLPVAEQQKRIAAAADVLRPLNSDIILLEEVRDYDVCARLAEAIAPHTYHVAICSAFREPFAPGIGKQQVAILAKVPAQAAWSETWKAMSGVDPPGPFALAAFGSSRSSFWNACLSPARRAVISRVALGSGGGGGVSPEAASGHCAP